LSTCGQPLSLGKGWALGWCAAPLTVSLGALFLGERPTLATLFGGVIVVASVAMLLIHRSGNVVRS
jgi:drug/metabolite transporter (DMT)-like permease